MRNQKVFVEEEPAIAAEPVITLSRDAAHLYEWVKAMLGVLQRTWGWPGDEQRLTHHFVVRIYNSVLLNPACMLMKVLAREGLVCHEGFLEGRVSVWRVNIVSYRHANWLQDAPRPLPNEGAVSCTISNAFTPEMLQGILQQLQNGKIEKIQKKPKKHRRRDLVPYPR